MQTFYHGGFFCMVPVWTGPEMITFGEPIPDHSFHRFAKIHGPRQREQLSNILLLAFQNIYET